MAERFVPDIITICEERRGEQIDLKALDNQRFIMVYKFPLNEIVVDFFDILKSTTSGYATFDYEDAGYELADLVKVIVLIYSTLLFCSLIKDKSKPSLISQNSGSHHWSAFLFRSLWLQKLKAKKSF